jgi:hypothetical protein
MTIPPQYAPWLAALGFHEIGFDVGGLKLFTPEELEEHQVGYSRSREGKSLCDGRPGAWQPEWLVIGYETGLGDPIFIDTSVPALPVLTAMHGAGSWEPETISLSLQDFATALRAFQEVSVGRESPVALERNPLSSEERARALQRIAGAQGDEIDMGFWELLLGEAFEG